MAIKDVTNLRKEGRLEEAFALAKREFEEDPNEWTRMSMFWVLRDYVKNVFIPNGDIEKAKECLRHMGDLLPNMIDDSEAGEKSYQYLRKQILPNADIIKKYVEQSKTDPICAYVSLTSQFGTKGTNIDEDLHEDFGWIVYRYMKTNVNQLTSVQIRTLLRDYMLLKNKRPSMLHSTILNFALSFYKGHTDFGFYRFFIMWGVENLRYEDYVNRYDDGHEIPSLISRICRAIVDSNETFFVQDFVDKFNDYKCEVIEHLRQSYFWKLMTLHKEGCSNELLKSFENYVESYSVIGPSHWHSEILKIAYRFMTEGNAQHFIPFMKQWSGPEFENLREEDWKREESEDGKEFPSLAIKSAKKCFECLKVNPNMRTPEFSSWLKCLYAIVIKKETEDDWSTRNYATVCIWSGSIEEAINTYKSLLVNMGDKYYLWSELSECISNNNSLRIGLLLKAKELEKNEDFIGKVHLCLAKLWMEENYITNAKQELCTYAKHRKDKGWAVSNLYLELSSKVNDLPDDNLNVDLVKLIRAAEDFVYADYKWHEYVLIDKWEHEGKEQCKFYDGQTIKSKKFRALKRSKVGNVYCFRCHITEEIDPSWNKSLRLRDTKTIKIVTPLVISLSNKEQWSLLPVKYGIVDYINKEKKVLHILTQDSKQVFCTYKKNDIITDTFVQFREFEDKRKDEIKTCIVDVKICPREDAISHMDSRVVVVDDVNEQKQLFHVVLGPGLVSDTVRFNQTDIRPNIGDFLRITYCIKKNKEGKQHIKFLEIVRSDVECKGVSGTVVGHLSVKYKDYQWVDEYSCEPDFAFVKDFYVHRSILRKYGIKNDCDVVAKVVLGGDNKWKVYALEVQ